jgi:hypothetical protein
VILQLTVKYTMFSPAGAPLRATVTVKLQEATRVSMAKDDDGGSGNAAGAQGKDGGGAASTDEDGLPPPTTGGGG